MNTIWFQFDSIRFRKDFPVVARAPARLPGCFGSSALIYSIKTRRISMSTALRKHTFEKLASLGIIGVKFKGPPYDLSIRWCCDCLRGFKGCHQMGIYDSRESLVSRTAIRLILVVVVISDLGWVDGCRTLTNMLRLTKYAITWDHSNGRLLKKTHYLTKIFLFLVGRVQELLFPQATYLI